MKTDEDKQLAFAQAFSNYLDTLDLGNDWYDFSIKVCKAIDKQKQKTYAFSQQILVKSIQEKIKPFDDDEVDRMLHMTQRLNLILGYAMGFIMPYGRTLKGEDKEKYKWLVQAVENLLYLNKPLPRMP